MARFSTLIKQLGEARKTSGSGEKPAISSLIKTLRKAQTGKSVKKPAAVAIKVPKKATSKRRRGTRRGLL